MLCFSCRYLGYSHLNSFRFPSLSIFRSRNAYFPLFVVFINLWDAPAAWTVADRSRHVSGNTFPVDTLQNKSSLSLQYVCIECVPVCHILFWKVVPLLRSSWATPITSIDYEFVAHFTLAEQPALHWKSWPGHVKIMFSNQGIQPVTVVFNNTKNCFLHLPSKLISHLSLNEVS